MRMWGHHLWWGWIKEPSAVDNIIHHKKKKEDTEKKRHNGLKKDTEGKRFKESEDDKWKGRHMREIQGYCEKKRTEKQRDQLKDSVFLLSHLSLVPSSPMAADRQVPTSTPVARTSRRRLSLSGFCSGLGEKVVPKLSAERPHRGHYILYASA